MKSCNFHLAILGYNSILSMRGLQQLAQNNPEQVLEFSRTNRYLILKDGTYIKALMYGNLEKQIRGWGLDQLILFDDYRWLIYIDRCKEIAEILGEMKWRSRVPEEFRVLRLENFRKNYSVNKRRLGDV